PSVNDNIKVSAKIKFYGKVEEATPLAAFEARSTINIDEDKFTFHIPNKNIVADMIIYLPKRDYDYIRSNSLNGDVTFQERSEEHTSELQSRFDLVCRLLLEKKNKPQKYTY